MEHNAADELHGIGPHAQHPIRRLPDGGEGLGQQRVQGLSPVQPLLELPGLVLQRFLGQLLVFRLQTQDFIHLGLQLLDLPLGAGAEYFGNKTHFSLLFR